MTTNGHVELPPERQRVVDLTFVQIQELYAERDRLIAEATRLHDELAAVAIENEGLRAQLNDASSRVETARLERDQAVATQVRWETVFVTIAATLSSHGIPLTYVHDRSDEDPPPIVRTKVSPMQYAELLQREAAEVNRSNGRKPSILTPEP